MRWYLVAMLKKTRFQLREWNNEKAIDITYHVVWAFRCSTPTDGTNAYLLPESTLDKPIFKVKTKVELPDYLDTIGIAYRKSENELVSARKHVWAET